MSWGRPIKEAFSPYQIAAGGMLLGYFFFLFSMGAFVNGRIAIGMLVGAVGLATAVASDVLSECPGCGKSPMMRSRDGVGWISYYLLKYRNRLWPEEICSQCGAELTALPDS